MRNKKTIALAMAAATVAPMAVPAFAAEEKAITQSPIAAGSVARYGLEDLNNRKIKRVSKENLAEEIRSLQAQNKEPKVVYREVKADGSFGDALVQYTHDRVAAGEVSATTMSQWKAQFAEAKSFIEYANSKNAVDGNTGAKLYNVSVKEEDYTLTTNNGFINNKKIVTVTENVDSNNNKTLDTFTFVFEAFDTTFKGEEVVVKTISDIDLTTANNVEAQYKRLAAVEYNLKKSLKNNTGLVVTTNKEEVTLTSNKKGFKYTVNIFKADAVTKVGQFVVYTPEDGIDKTKVVAQPKVTNDFSGHWAEESIVNAMLNGVVTTTETFNPKKNITRAEFAAVIYNTLKSQGKLVGNAVQGMTTGRNDRIVFTDVSSKDWFAQPIMELAKAGYLNGNPDGTFKPNAPISRQEAAKIMSDVIYKATQETYKVDFNGNKLNVDIKTKFSDDSTIASWADESVQALVDLDVEGTVINTKISGKVISGDAGKNTFRGKDSISRAEALIMAERAGLAGFQKK